MLIAQWKILSAALLLAATAGTAWAQEHAHHSHGHEVLRLTLDNGKKWATDENLKLAMGRIRDALAAELPAIHSGKATAEQYRALAQKIDDQIAFMVKNCHLDQRTDDMLHLVLADIITASHTLATQGGMAARKGVEKIAGALENYGAYFDHPGWHGVKHTH